MLYNSAETTPKYNAKAKYYKVDANGKPVGEGKTFNDETSFAVWFDAVGQCWEEKPEQTPAATSTARPVREKGITNERRTQVRTTNEQETLSVPQRLADKGEGFQFTAKINRFDAIPSRSGGTYLGTQITTEAVTPPATFFILENANDTIGGELTLTLSMVETRNGLAMGVKRA